MNRFPRKDPGRRNLSPGRPKRRRDVPGQIPTLAAVDSPWVFAKGCLWTLLLKFSFWVQF
jgi:hypothetical protein